MNSKVKKFRFNFLLLTTSLLMFACNSYMIVHKGYSSIMYSKKHHQAIYAKYVVKPANVYGKVKRLNYFKTDVKIDSSLSASDYRYSGFDRGHLKPAAVSKSSLDEMKESFLLSNISPQNSKLNRGVWKSIEEYTRGLLKTNDSITVYTGTVFPLLKGFNRLGDSKITIPKFFFKAVLLSDSSTVAFLCENDSIQGAISNYVTTVNKIEKKIRQDLFPGLPECFEDKLYQIKM